ncbi:MAG: hypothetical protein R2801_04605 [Chitinophagales bacterium]
MVSSYTVTYAVVWRAKTIQAATLVDVCSRQSATLVASDPNGEVYNFLWYSDAALNNIVYEGNSFVVPNLTSDTMFYVTGICAESYAGSYLGLMSIGSCCCSS